VLQIAIAEEERSVPTCDVRAEVKCLDSLLPMIQEKLELPDCPASELLRMILIEQVRMIQELSVNEPNRAKASYRLRAFRAQFVSLRTLATLVRQMEKSKKKEDQLKFDGPTVTHLVSGLVDCFEQALKETIGKNDPATQKSVLLHLSDIMAMAEPELRRKFNSLQIA
jgi:hypothetical protein